MTKIYELKVERPELKMELERILGRDTVRVTTSAPRALPMPMLGRLVVYLLDLQALTQAEFDQLVAHIATKYGLGRLIALSRLQDEGFIIPANAGTLRIREAAEDA